MLSDERDDELVQAQLAGEEQTQDEDAIEQDEHPIDMETEEPTERKTLKRVLKQQALIRLENAARSEGDFEEVIKWWDRLDQNRERRERYHEVLRSGDEFPLEYGASPDAPTYPDSLNHVLEKQVRKGDFLDVISNCPHEIQELVSDPVLIQILANLKDEQKELLYLCGVQYLSAAKAAEIRGQTERNIRKVRSTLIKKINQQIQDMRSITKQSKQQSSYKPSSHEKYLMKKLAAQHGKGQAVKEEQKKNTAQARATQNKAKKRTKRQ